MKLYPIKSLHARTHVHVHPEDTVYICTYTPQWIDYASSTLRLCFGSLASAMMLLLRARQRCKPEYPDVLTLLDYLFPS